MGDSAPISNQIRSDVLSGWKEVANYFGKGVRTVQRYEHTLKLPVRRPAGKPRGSVLATRSELDRWVQSARLAGHPEIPEPTKPRGPEIASLRHAIDLMRNLRQQTKQLQAECRNQRKILREKVQLLCLGARQPFEMRVSSTDPEARKAS